MGRRDQNYIIDLCDVVLQTKASREHRFAFLLGNPNKSGVTARLPVDAFYPGLMLAIEYHERQHSEAVAFFDRRTVIGGISRGEQRRRYDERRKEVLPANGIDLVIFAFNEFDHDSSKRLRRTEDDLSIVRAKLAAWAHRPASRDDEL